jgi:Xaa-Pro aminopeptidase
MTRMAERLICPISTSELERRWAAVRAAMEGQAIDVLLMQSSNEFSGGYVKWFTDLPSGNGTMTTVVFPKDDLMTVVAHGPFGVDQKPPAGDPVRRGVKRFLASPNFMGASFTTALDTANTETALAGFSGATIGLVATGSIGHALIDHLKRGKLGNSKFVDATDLVDRIMVIKSDEEIEKIRATAALQDRAMRAAFDAIRPGMRDIEVTAVAENYTRVAGAEYGLLPHLAKTRLFLTTNRVEARTHHLRSRNRPSASPARSLALLHEADELGRRFARKSEPLEREAGAHIVDADREPG